MVRDKQQKLPVPDWLTPHVYKAAEEKQSNSVTLKHQKHSKPQLQKPRLPTPQEQKELIDYVMEKDNQPEDQRSNLTSLFFGGDCPVVVFDHYVTYGLTYSRKLLVVVGDIDPYHTSYQLFYLEKNGKIEEVTRSTMKHLRKEIKNAHI